jgi:hypothetical protein
MAWIKRNLFFFIGLLIAVFLLAAAGVYDFKSWQRNQNALQSLTEISGTLQTDNSNHQVSEDNIQVARDQQKQYEDWINQARAYFQPIPPIPNPPGGQVTSEMFAPALSSTVKQLLREAADASVQLPPNDFFSFTAESDKAVFDPTTLGDLAQQLGEVKALVEILYGAKVNELENIQRVPLSKDDIAGNPADYLVDQPITTGQAVMMPYQVTFRGFSSDIANVLNAFATSSHEFIVRTISVQPATAQAASYPNNPENPGPYNQYYRGQLPPGNDQMNPARPMMPSFGGLQTVLDEQLLRVTMEIEVVKLTPAN